MPTSPPAASLAPNDQMPFNWPAVLIKGVNVVAVGVNPAGAKAAKLPSAIKVPVNGTTPVANEVALAELITVLVKLSPLPPRAFTKFNTWPLGDFINNVKSPSQVWVILKFTRALVPVAVAGTPATVNDVPTPVALASGIATAITPELTDTLPGVGAACAVNFVGSPAHNTVPLSDTIAKAPTPAETKVKLEVPE